MNGKFDEENEAQRTPPQGVTELTHERGLTNEERCDYRQKEALVYHLRACKKSTAGGWVTSTSRTLLASSRNSDLTLWAVGTTEG